VTEEVTLLKLAGTAKRPLSQYKLIQTEVMEEGEDQMATRLEARNF